MFAHLLSLIGNLFHAALAAAAGAHASGHAVPVCSAVASAVLVPACSLAGVPWLAGLLVPAVASGIDFVLKRIEVVPPTPPTPSPAAA